MNYNFTDRVRKVLAMAREDAIRLQHDHVDTEHLLLGLIREGQGVAAAVLTNLSVHLNQVRERIEELVPPGEATTLPLELPYTSRSKRVLEFAMAEARELKHSYVGTEHLLLGLLREEKGIAAETLNQLGVTLDEARRQMLKLLGVEPERERSQGGRLNSAVDKGSARAVHEQIMEPVIEAFVAGVLRPGQRLPSVRQLSNKLEVAPDIVAQAYGELERRGLLIIDAEGEVRIADAPAKTDIDLRLPETLIGLLRPVVIAAIHLGATAPDLRSALEEAMRGVFDSPQPRA